MPVSIPPCLGPTDLRMKELKKTLGTKLDALGAAKKKVASP